MLKSKTTQRDVYIGRYQKYLRDWLVEHPWRSDPDAYLFPARTKEPYPQVNRATIYNYILKLKKLGINTRFYPTPPHTRRRALRKACGKGVDGALRVGTRTMLDIMLILLMLRRKCCHPTVINNGRETNSAIPCALGVEL